MAKRWLSFSLATNTWSCTCTVHGVDLPPSCVFLLAVCCWQEVDKWQVCCSSSVNTLICERLQQNWRFLGGTHFVYCNLSWQLIRHEQQTRSRHDQHYSKACQAELSTGPSQSNNWGTMCSAMYDGNEHRPKKGKERAVDFNWPYMFKSVIIESTGHGCESSGHGCESSGPGVWVIRPWHVSHHGVNRPWVWRINALCGFPTGRTPVSGNEIGKSQNITESSLSTESHQQGTFGTQLLMPVTGHVWELTLGAHVPGHSLVQLHYPQSPISKALLEHNYSCQSQKPKHYRVFIIHRVPSARHFWNTITHASHGSRLRAYSRCTCPRS